MAEHVIRYDGVDYPVTPDILTRVFNGISLHTAQHPEMGAVVQRLDLLSESGSVLLVLGLGAGLTFRTSTALAQQLCPDND